MRTNQPIHIVMDVHVHHEPPSPTGPGIESQLADIRRLLAQLTQMEGAIMSDLTSLQAEVEANTTVVDSVKALVQRLADEIAAAGTDQPALDALVASLRANDGTLADLVTANTPVETPPADTPPAG
jgi:ABC-type transporter Mla subunit MlaD